VTDCGLSEALSVIVTLAERLPAAVGLNVTLMVQVPPAATLEVVQVFVWAKSGPLVPVMATVLTVSAALPLFVTVIV
jgi:low affinity Fe/Cu permease